MWLRKSPSTTACCVHRINCWDLPFHPDLLRCTHVEITPRRITRHSCAVLFCGLSQYMHRTGISDDGSHFQLDSLRGLQLNDYCVLGATVRSNRSCVYGDLHSQRPFCTCSLCYGSSLRFNGLLPLLYGQPYISCACCSPP
jgi:hypothetical protein